MKLNIALLGCGTIGSCVARELLTGNYPGLTLKKVLVNNINKDRNIDGLQELLTNNINDIINDQEINLVIEVLGNEEPALSYVLDCIKNNKHIVTANKELMAKHGYKIFKLASENNVHVKLEASVAGGIPVISTLLEDLKANNIQQITGILNGTTNYILTEMQAGAGFADTLKKSQELGYAEPDPTNDIEGYDVRYKLALLASIAFGQGINPEIISCKGITEVTSHDFEIAQEMGYTVKLLGITKKSNNKVIASVYPYLVPASHPLAKIDGVLNGVAIKGHLVNEVLLVGPGAGAEPTTSSILGDVITIQKQVNSVPTIPYSEPDDNISLGEDNFRAYFRLEVEDKLGVMASIGQELAQCNISINSIIQKHCDDKTYISLLTHHISEAEFNTAVNNLNKINHVKHVCLTLKALD